ncbi:hypothetical protein L798_00415 [Zootermopsis nevadensis]|uniref:Uncharacterized protein n=1 Tax=Zootermopsis nevadensis TaxID=136037 RepID=A0A067QV20_ZOONE|nr:hypothetical protein L798_00415 [Zootermopsis nevadensis]
MAESKHSSDEGACWDNSGASMPPLQSGSIPSSPWAVTHHYSTGSHPRRAYGAVTTGDNSVIFVGEACASLALECTTVGIRRMELSWFWFFCE